MNFALVLLFALLAMICKLVKGLTIIVESPDGDLLKLVQLSQNWLVYHTENNAYIDFSVKGSERGVRYTCHPAGTIEAKRYPNYPIPTYSHLADGWAPAIFPAKDAIEEGLTTEAWLESTGFQDQRSDLLYAWLEEREAGEPFTVAILFSIPKEIDSPDFSGDNLERLLVYHTDDWVTLPVREGRELWSLSEEDKGKRRLVGSSLVHQRKQSTRRYLQRSIGAMSKPCDD